MWLWAPGRRPWCVWVSLSGSGQDWVLSRAVSSSYLEERWVRGDSDVFGPGDFSLLLLGSGRLLSMPAVQIRSGVCRRAGMSTHPHAQGPAGGDSACGHPSCRPLVCPPTRTGSGL